MKVNQMFPSRYVSGEDLNGKAWPVTIRNVTTEKMHPNPQAPEVEKFVLYTVEGRKGIVLGKVLAEQIQAATGQDDTEQWPGCKITIFAERVNVAGRELLAIRARGAAVEESHD